MNSEKKIALVTGAGTGIGKATALALLNAGYQVIFSGRRKDILDAAISEARQRTEATENSLAIGCDVTNSDSVDQLFAMINSKFGRLDVLFNNAGVAAPDVAFEDLSVEQWQTVINANLTGPFLCSKAAFRLMKNQEPKGGRIINNGSLAATTPRPKAAPYTASKHGVTGLTKALALDGRQHNIACCQIDIGNAATEMAAVHNAGALQANGETQIEPLMDVNHVATAVVHMADLPLEANVLFMTVMATQMPFVGRG